MAEIVACDDHALLGRDLQPVVGQRVAITAAGRQWDQAKRGDPGMGGLGSVHEVREGVCLVQWDTGVIQPYPTGALQRFYVAAYPLVPAQQWHQMQQQHLQQQQQQQHFQQQQQQQQLRAQQEQEDRLLAQRAAELQAQNQRQLQAGSSVPPGHPAAPEARTEDHGKKGKNDSRDVAGWGAPGQPGPESTAKSKRKSKDMTVSLPKPSDSMAHPHTPGAMDRTPLGIDTPSSAKRRKGSKTPQGAKTAKEGDQGLQWQTPKDALGGGDATISLQYQGKWLPLAVVTKIARVPSTPAIPATPKSSARALLGSSSKRPSSSSAHKGNSGQVRNLFEALAASGVNFNSVTACGALGALGRAITSMCLQEDGTFDASQLAGSASGGDLHGMTTDTWQALVDTINEGVANFDGTMGEAQWSAVDAACVLLCVLCCPSSEELLQDSVVQSALCAIEQALRRSESEQMEGGSTPKASGRRKSGGGSKMARAYSSAGKVSLERSGVLCCSMAAAGALASAKKLQEEQAHLARKIALMAVTNPGGQAIRSFGVVLLRDVCVGFPAMRMEIVEEIFVHVTSDAWLSDAGSVRMQGGKQGIEVSATSAALVRIIQCSSGARTTSASDAKGEGGMAVDEDDGEADAASGAQSLCTRFFTLVGTRALKKGSAAKNKDAELRGMLEVLIGDMLALLFCPEWPAAESLLLSACGRLDWFLAGRNVNVNVSYKAIAVDLLGRVIEALTDQRIVDKQQGQAVLGLTPDDEEVGDEGLPVPVQGADVVGATMEKFFEGHGKFAGVITEYVPSDELHSPDSWRVEYEDGDVEDLEWSDLFHLLLKKDAEKFIKEAGLRKEAAARLQGLVLTYLRSNPAAMPHTEDAAAFYAVELKWLANRPEEDLIGDVDTAVCASRRLAMARPLAKSLGKRIQLLLGVLETRGSDIGAGSARMRQRVLQALTHVVKTDVAVLQGSQALTLVRQRYSTDPSALVRSSAIDMLCHFAAPERRLPRADLDIVCGRTMDVASSVRLQAITVLAKAIEWLRETECEDEQGSDEKADACAKLCGMIRDQDESVQKRVVRLIFSLWFQTGSFALPMVSREVVSVMGRGVQEETVASMHVALLKKILGGGSESDVDTIIGDEDNDEGEIWVNESEAAQAHSICAELCNEIVNEVEGTLKAHDLSSEQCQRLVALFTTLRRFGEASHILLQPYTHRLAKIAMLPSPTPAQPLPPGPAADSVTALRCRVLGASANVVKIVLYHAAETVVSKEAALQLQRHLSSLTNRVPETRALQAVVECLCACSRTELAGGVLPSQMLAKYVNFIGAYIRERKEAHLRYVTTALLGAGSLCQHLDFSTVLDDEKAIESCKKHQSNLVTLCVEKLAEDNDERLRRCSFQCLGGLMVRTPTLLLQKKVSTLVASALGAAGDAVSQLAVLRAFRLFLEEEDFRISQSTKSNKPKSGKEAVATERVSSMSTSLSNDFLPLILEAMFSASQEGDGDSGKERQREAVRSEATCLVGVIVRRGLTAPQRVAPHLVALGAKEDATSATAGRVYESLLARHRDLSSPNLIMEGIMMAYSRTQWPLDSDCPPLPAAPFALCFKHMSSRGADVRILVKGLLRKAEQVHGEYEDIKRRCIFVAHTLANFSYATVDGPLTIIHTIANQALFLGTTAIQGIRATVELEEGGGSGMDSSELQQLCTKGMVVSILLSLSKHLQSGYNLSDTKVRGFTGEKEQPSKADKAVVDVMPPFSPTVLFPKGYDASNGNETLKAHVSKLEKQMLACHIGSSEELGASGTTPARGPPVEVPATDQGQGEISVPAGDSA